MAQRFDVPARLAEGRDAVRHTEIYVAACRQLGYRHPDLTGYGGQVGDWYDGEAGLDLHLLDADCAQLWALADAAEGALQMQRGQLGELAAAWRGSGAAAAAEFLRRHCEAGAAVTARLATAARAVETLRDELWRLMDDKAATAIGIDDRVAGRRPEWLAAAHAVTAGAADRHAEDIIEQRVMPYVDNDIGAEWVSKMRSSRTAVSAAYDAAIAEVEPGSGVVFGIPAELGRWARPEPAPLSAGSQMPAVTAMAVPPVSAEPLAAAPVAAPEAEVSSALPESAEPTAALGAPGDFGLPAGMGLPGMGALGGLLPGIGNALGGLLGSSGAGFGEPAFGGPFDGLADAGHPDEPTADEAADEAPEDNSDETSDDGPDQPDSQSEHAEPVADDASGAESGGSAQEVAADTPVAGEAQADPAGQQVGEATPEPAEKTPCEIAADELPQVGQ